MYAQKEFYIDPASALNTGLSIKMARVSILGSVGTLAVLVIGAGILTMLEESTRSLFGGSGRGTDQIIYVSRCDRSVVSQRRPGWLQHWRKRRRQGKGVAR